MKPDEYISINGQVFEIIRKPEVLDPEDGSPLMGNCDTARGTISISTEYPADVQASVLLHELLHAVADSAGLDLDEKQILGLERGLWSAGVRVKTKKRRTNRNHKEKAGDNT